MSQSIYPGPTYRPEPDLLAVRWSGETDLATMQAEYNTLLGPAPPRTCCLTCAAVPCPRSKW